MESKRRGGRSFLAGMIVCPPKHTIVAVCVWLLVYQPLPSWAWQSDSPGLEIVVLRGDGATHLIRSGRFEESLVEVRLDGRPVKGARVGFQLPESGPGGFFDSSGQVGAQHRTTWGVTTGENGRAVGEGFVANKEPGNYVIRVGATYDGRSAEAELRQTNAWFDSAMTGKKIKVKLQDGRVMKGFISQVSEDNFLLVERNTGQPVSIAHEEVTNYSTPMSIGAKAIVISLVAFGVAVAVMGILYVQSEK